MKRAFFVLLALLCAVLMPGCGQKDDVSADRSLERIKSKGVFVVGLDDAFPPMGFREKENGEIIGFDIDLARAVAERIGVKAVFKPVPWGGVILSLNRGDIDVIWNGLSITQEREKEIIFSKPYLKNRQVVIVRSGSQITGKAGLVGKKVGLQLGSSSEKALNSDPEIVKSLNEVKKYPDNQLALLDLEAGRIDAVVVDEVVGRYNILRRPGAFEVLSDNFGDEVYGVGFRRGDVAFRDAIDKELDVMKKDGSADEIARKWFGVAVIKK